MNIIILLLTSCLLIISIFCKAQNTGLMTDTTAKPITIKGTTNANKAFFYGDQKIARQQLGLYLSKYKSSATEYEKSVNNQKTIYFVFGSEVLLGAAGFATLKNNKGLATGLFIAANAGTATCIYLLIKQNAHRNKAIKLYNQNVL